MEIVMHTIYTFTLLISNHSEHATDMEPKRVQFVLTFKNAFIFPDTLERSFLNETNYCKILYFTAMCGLYNIYIYIYIYIYNISVALDCDAPKTRILLGERKTPFTDSSI